MKRLNKITKRITAYDELAEQFINECEESGNFDDNQIDEIREGFEIGLTMEQVKVYAKPEFNNRQMNNIRWGFINGLSMEQVKVYAKPEINLEQMSDIRDDLENGISIEEVKEEYNL